MRKLIEHKRERLNKKISDWRWKRFQKASHERAPEPKLRRRPDKKEINCRVTAQTFEIRAPFHYVDRVVIHLEFATNAIEVLKFGVDAALTNGISLRYNGQEIMNVKSSSDLMHYSYDWRVHTDDRNPKVRSLVSRYSFDKFTDDQSLRVRDFEKLELVIQDDLSASLNTEIFFTFEGWVQ